MTKYRILLIMLATLALSACVSSTIKKDAASNATKQEILRVANKVDEIRVFQVLSEPNAERKDQLLDGYLKGSVDFESFIKELTESKGDGTHMLGANDRSIVMLSKDRALMKLEGYSGNGQFVWSDQPGVTNFIYLSVKGKRFTD